MKQDIEHIIDDNRAAYDAAMGDAIAYIHKMADFAMKQGNRYDVYYYMRQADQLETHWRKVRQYRR